MAKSDEKFLKEARERWDLANTAQQNQRKREVEDLEFYAGKQWPQDLLDARKGITLGSGTNQQVVPARPSLVINKTIEPVRQVLNQERQADLGYELVPADDFGEFSGPIDHTEIELREGLVRRIQRDSEAEDARTWSFARAAIAGQGYRLVMTRYLPGKRADQEIYIERIYDQNSVLLDPSHEQADGSDAAWGFYGTDMLWSRFIKEHPDAKVSDIDTDDEWRSLTETTPGWFEGEGEKRAVRVMNYYYTERDAKEVYHLANGAGAYDDELVEVAEGQRALASDPSILVVKDEDGNESCHIQTEKKIKWAKIVGNEVLEQTDWPGRWLPIIKEVGEELQPFDQERRYQGVVRPMLDACRGNNYVISKFVERVGLTPIPPWMMAGGQDSGYEEEYNYSTTRTLGRLHYNQKDEEGAPAPPPFRVDARAEIADIAAGVSLFGQAIASTSAVPETALGNTDPTVKSGKLARALIEQADRSTTNFMDNHKRSLRHEARVVNDLLFPIYGRPGRLVHIVNGQGDQDSVLIGTPFTLQGEGKQKRPVPVPQVPNQPLPPNAKLYKLTKDADFNVAVKITKSIDTRRQEIVAFLSELIGADPAQMAIVGDKLFKYLDVPDHAELEKRYQLMLAPPIQQLISGENPLPPEAQQKIAMLEAQIQEMAPLVDKNKADLMKAEGQEAAETQRKAADLASREKIEKWKIEAMLEIEMAKLGNAAMMKRAEMDAQMLHTHTQAQLDQQAARSGQEAQIIMAEQTNAHAMEQQAQKDQAALAQQREAQEAAASQQQMGHVQALEQQAQAAALAPEPTGPQE